MLRKYGLAAATGVLVVICLVALAGSFKSAPQLPELETPSVLGLPSLAGMKLSEENSGELWRKSVRSADGKFIKEQHVAYQDGRFGVFHFEQGRFVRFVGYATDSNSPVTFEADYDAISRMKASRSYRADGSLEATYSLQADGLELRTWFGENGRDAVRKTETRIDGSQTETVWTDGVPKVTQTKADEVDHKIGQRIAPDGTVSAALIITMKGVRVKAWYYFGSKANLLHTGRVQPDGTIEITVFSADFKKLYCQHWRPAGEDWNRAFYRVKRLEAFNESTGKMSVAVDFHDDGISVKQAISYDSWGRPYLLDEFDAKGFFIARSIYNHQTRGWMNRTEVPLEHRQQVRAPKQFLVEPLNEKGRQFYRLGGLPFTTKPEAGQSSMFVLP
jgi:hypothetical protein